MNVRNMLLAATVLVLPAAMAMAQPVEGPYVGAGVGYNWTQNIDLKSFNGYDGSGVTANGNGGVIGVGSVGWGFGDIFGTGGGFRVEVEGNYRGNNYHLDYNGSKISNGVNADTYGVLVNALYDFNLGPVNPYVGVGGGYEWTTLNQNGGNGSVTGGAAAVQGIVGASIPVGVPGLSVTTEVRFLATVENTKFSQDGYSATFGNQYNWSDLVFFDWDRADLTARARQIIAEAAQASTHVQLTQIEVSGYADRTGTAQYNLGLSRRRADNVAAELVRLGVPRNEIAIQAFGDTHLLVPTAEGVREPQNRRVEIVLK
jgi:OOP family OmpA-OmpF porin